MKRVKILLCLSLMISFSISSSFAYRSEAIAAEMEEDMFNLVDDMMNGYQEGKNTCALLAEWGVLMVAGIVGTVILIKNRSTHQHGFEHSHAH